MNSGDVLSPLDGRYQKQVEALAQVCGARAFAAARVRAEVAWLLTLNELHIFAPLPKAALTLLDKLPHLTEKDLRTLDAIEKVGSARRPATRHDVKAVEYFVADRLAAHRLQTYTSWVHFGLTSEDINSAAYAQLLSDAVGVILPQLEMLRKNLAVLARKYAGAVLLARTHGQPAVPTTFGRELRVFENRLARQLAQLKAQQISCKFGGAVGAYNAHVAAFPSVNWTAAAKSWVKKLNQGRKTKIYLSPISTQIDPRDSYAELFDTLRRIHIILLGLSRDMWQYISSGLVKQKAVSTEVGSSTMPQKINPIDFENAEGNLGLANALLTFFSEKLPLSRLQRDLSDSTVLRNMAVAFGHGVVAYQSLLKGLAKITFDTVAACEELAAHPEVLAEAYQILLRAVGVPNAYEQVKDLIRGHSVTREDLEQFVQKLQVPKTTKQKLLALTAGQYIGLAQKQARGEYD